MRKLLLAAVGLLAVIGGPAFGADVTPKQSQASTFSTPDLAPGMNWGGAYVLAGLAIEAQTLEIEGSPIDFGTENAAILGRIGYRWQRDRIVAGVFGEIQASDTEILDGALEANFAYGTGADLGLALGGVLLSIEGGFQWMPVDGDGAFDLDLSGPFAGVKAAIDIGGGWDVGLGVRRYFLNDEVGGVDLDNYTTSGVVTVGKRF